MFIVIITFQDAELSYALAFGGDVSDAVSDTDNSDEENDGDQHTQEETIYRSRTISQ